MSPEMRVRANDYYRALRRFHPDPHTVRLDTKPLHLSHQVGTSQRLTASVPGPSLFRVWVHLPNCRLRLEQLQRLEADLPQSMYYNGPEGSLNPIFWARVALPSPGPGCLPMSLLQRSGMWRFPAERSRTIAWAMLWLAQWVD